MELAKVIIWGQLAGAVVWNEDLGYATFEYDAAFKNTGLDLSPLMMPIDASQQIFSFPNLRRKAEPELDTFKGLPGLLADVLPDRYGNELINLWLTQQGRSLNSMNPVEMLCFIGTRGMGALEFEPTTLSDSHNIFSVEVESLVEKARELLGNKEAFSTHLDKQEERSMLEILRIGTSAGGARPKAVIAYNEKTGEVRSGQAKAPQGFEHWLLKLDGVSEVQLGHSYGYGRVEMAYYNMARACGIEMMPSRLLEENGRAHFMTRRFDREDKNIKHHIQTFCAIRHFDYNAVNSFSYEQLFQTMRELRLTYPEAEQMFRRMVFNVLAQNCDDHTKNFAFRLKKEGRWELAPAYDLCHAYKPEHRWVRQHALSVNGKRRDITKDDFLALAKTIKTGKENWAGIIEEVNTQVKKWKDFAEEVKVKPDLRDEIDKTLIKY